MTFPIIPVSVSPSSFRQLEQLGTKAKFWYHLDDQLILFKVGRPNTGENWAEKACCEIARLLDLPHAEYELARWGDKKGVITPSVVPKNGGLILGNELLARVYDKYEPAVRYKSGQHTLRRVITVLQQDIDTPIGWYQPQQVDNAIGVFIGYLLLDTLVANQDRHHENWGLITTLEYGLTLAPTFDHASSLGRNETDINRSERLSTKDKGYSVQSYVGKARSGFFSSRTSLKAMSTLDAFSECAKANTRAALYWLDRLYALTDSDFANVLYSIPDDFISQPAREFAHAMLITNRNRLLSLEANRYP